MGAESIPHYCGVMAVWGSDHASELVFHGLYSLQHRGQEAVGIVSTDGDRFYQRHGFGTLNRVFDSPEKLHDLKGYAAVGHTRYSTTGASKNSNNIQPLTAMLRHGPVAIGHNGNLVNTQALRDELQKDGAIFQSSTDSEIVIHLMARSKEETFRGKLRDAISRIDGAFSIVMLTDHAIYAARDIHGFRPLCIGVKGNSTVIASESCALDLLGYEYVRDVEPGELIRVNDDGWDAQHFAEKGTTHHCVFESIYFSRPDSKIFGEFVDKSRRKMGKNLAKLHPADADIVISVPDSSNTAALGYSLESGIKFELGLIRNHYVGRTFIQPTKAMREMGVKLKFNPVGGVIKDKRVVIVDDSIVRGTTLKKLCKLLKHTGAKEVHVRVSSPPIRFPCYYGMDFPTSEELIAFNREIDEIADHLNVDTLGYLDVESLLASVRQAEGTDYCTACFTGKYPVKIADNEHAEAKQRYDNC